MYLYCVSERVCEFIRDFSHVKVSNLSFSRWTGRGVFFLFVTLSLLGKSH